MDSKEHFRQTILLLKSELAVAKQGTDQNLCRGIEAQIAAYETILAQLPTVKENQGNQNGTVTDNGFTRFRTL